MAKRGKFAKKYGLFLSDASNEEIVSVSKELMNGMSAEIKTVSNTAVAILASSLIAIILMISLISGMDSTLTGNVKSVIFLTRITSVALLAIASTLAGVVMIRISDASSISSIFWRNIRETADDESAYEQTQAVKVISTLLMNSKQHLKMTALALALSTVSLGFGFIYELLVAASYI